MNKRALWLVGFIIIAICGGVVFLLANSSDNTAQQNTAEQAQAQADQAESPNQDVNTVSAAGSYVDYSQSSIPDSPGIKLLFFHASWCPQCRALDADIKKVGVPSGVIIVKVDYDSNQALRQKYGVTLQTTFVKVDDDGNLLEKYVAYDDPTLAAVKENLL